MIATQKPQFAFDLAACAVKPWVSVRRKSTCQLFVLLK
jgi:hypothetical protein